MYCIAHAADILPNPDKSELNLDNNVALVIDQGAGHWMLDTGLERYSVDFLKEEERSHSFSQHPAAGTLIVRFQPRNP